MPVPQDFADRKLTIQYVEASNLCRIFKTPPGSHPVPVFYGTDAKYRFDCPLSSGSKFGVVYAAYELITCFAEVISRDRNCKDFVNKGILLSEANDINNRYVANLYANIPLKLADLTDLGLYHLGAEAGEFHSIDYKTHTQPWALKIHERPENVDGLIYFSRFLNGKKAVAIFDRGGARVSLGASASIPLKKHRQYSHILSKLNIALIP